MANRFYKPQIASTPYHEVDRFMPLPFSDIANVLKERQGRYDDAANADLAAKDKLSQFQTRNIDIDSKNQLLDQYNQDIMDTVNTKHGGDWGSAGQDVSNIARKYAQNPFFQKAKQAYEQEQSHNKFLDDAKRAGKPVLDFDRSFYDTPLMNEEGGFNDLKGPESQLRLNWEDAMKSSTALHANTFTSAAKKAGGDAAGYLNYVKTNGISDPQVRNSLNDARIRFMATKEGAQMVDYMTRAQGLSREDAMAQVDEQLLAAGMQQVHTNQDIGYMTDLQDARAFEMEKAQLAARAKVMAAKKEAISSAPKMVPNTTNQGLTTKDDTDIWFTSDKVSLPYMGKSSKTYNQKMASYKPTRTAYAFGDNEEEASDATPTGETYKDVTFKTTIAGYKIVDGKRAGAPLTKGEYGSIDSAPDNHVEREKETGKHYVINADNEKVYVQPAAYKLFTTSNGKTILEEANKFESYRDLGYDFSNEDFVELDQRSGTVRPKVTTDQIIDYMGGPESMNNPQMMQALERMSTIERDGVKTPEDAQFVQQFNAALNRGFYENVVLPRTITPKPEYTPKGALDEGADDKLTGDED